MSPEFDCSVCLSVAETSKKVQFPITNKQAPLLNTQASSFLSAQLERAYFD